MVKLKLFYAQMIFLEMKKIQSVEKAKIIDIANYYYRR